MWVDSERFIYIYLYKLERNVMCWVIELIIFVSRAGTAPEEPEF